MKIIYLYVLLICLTIVKSFDIKNVKTISRKMDVFRKYQQFDFGGSGYMVPYQFMLVGASAGGTLSSNVSGKIDTSLFRYQTMPYTFPSLTFSYAEGNINFDITKLQLNFGVSAIATGFMPTFIIEYTEENGVDGFQLDGDSVVGMVDLSKYTYKSNYKKEELKGDDGKPFNIYHVSSTSKNGLFQMNFTVSERSVGIDGNAISASQTKVDIGIYNYYDPNINKNELDFCNLPIPSWAEIMPSIPSLTLPPLTLPPLTLPPITIPPVTLPPVTLPPVTVPPVTVPPVTVPPVTLPPLTLPPVTFPSFPLESDKVETSNANIPIPVICDGTTGPSSKQSKLALLSFVGAVKLKLNDKGQATVTVDIGKNFSVSYDWIGKAKINTGSGAKNSKVHSNVTDSSKGSKFGSSGIGKFLSDPQSLFITYSFDGVRPSSIEWDPTLGASNYEQGKTDNGYVEGYLDDDDSLNSGYKTISSLIFIAIAVLIPLLI